MNSLAIPATPPTATPSTDTAGPPATDGKRFDDTLRQSQQPASKPHDDGHPADDDAGVPKPEGRGTTDDAGGPKHKGHETTASAQNDKDSGDTNAPAGLAPMVMTVTAPVRQPLANGGKALPPISGKSVRAATSAAVVNIATAAPAGAKIAAAASQPGAPVQTSADANLAAALKMSAGDAGAQVVTDDKDKMAVSHDGPDSFIAHLAQLAVTHTGSTPAPTPPAQVQLTMQAAPGQPQFAQETAQHVAWLAGQNIQRAEIQLNPKKLGPIQVEITTHQDHVDVNFAVQHPQTVHALQQTLPQLQHMLAQQGLNLGHASVGQQAHGQQYTAPTYHPGGDSAGTEPDSQPTPLRVRIAAPGRVDDFA
jgi:flagellar hook-length control protein FliK